MNNEEAIRLVSIVDKLVDRVIENEKNILFILKELKKGEEDG